MMGRIVPRLMDFEKGPVNKSNAILELWKLCHQNLLFNNGHQILLTMTIDAKCNKYVIIIYCILALIPHEAIIFCHIIMFHEQDETKQTLFWGQFGQSLK
jgi:hypothetical protein